MKRNCLSDSPKGNDKELVKWLSEGNDKELIKWLSERNDKELFNWLSEGNDKELFKWLSEGNDKELFKWLSIGECPIPNSTLIKGFVWPRMYEIKIVLFLKVYYF